MSLTLLPPEILIAIANHLSIADSGALRQACRRLDAALFGPFAQEFFGTRQCMLTESSLQQLVAISRSRFAPFVQVLVLGLEYYTIVPKGPSNAPPLPHDQELAVDRYYIAYASQRTLMATGQDVAMLTEALAALRPSTLRVTHWDFRKRGERRVLKRTVDVFKTYKQNHVTSFYGTQVCLAMESVFAATVLAKLFSVLGRCGWAPEVLAIDDVPDGGFNIPPYLEDSLSPLLASVKALSVRIRVAAPCGNFERLVAAGDDRQTPVRIRTFCVRRFLSLCTGLHHLIIKDTLLHQKPKGDHFFAWLAEPPPLQATPGFWYAALDNLHTLEIQFTTMLPETLVALVQKLRATLRTLNLSGIGLYDDSEEFSATPWRQCLRAIAMSGADLKAIDLSSLGTVIMSNKKRSVCFLTEARHELHVSHTGPFAMEMLLTSAASACMMQDTSDTSSAPDSLDAAALHGDADGHADGDVDGDLDDDTWGDDTWGDADDGAETVDSIDSS